MLEFIIEHNVAALLATQAPKMIALVSESI